VVAARIDFFVAFLQLGGRAARAIDVFTGKLIPYGKLASSQVAQQHRSV
jgi:hypothetical protein